MLQCSTTCSPRRMNLFLTKYQLPESFAIHFAGHLWLYDYFWIVHYPFFHHYQGSIDFNIVNIHPTEEMYFFVPMGNRDDIEWNDQQRSSYPILPLLPGVYGSILSLGTVFPCTLPREDIRNTSSRINIDNIPDISNANTSRQAICWHRGCTLKMDKTWNV